MLLAFLMRHPIAWIGGLLLQAIAYTGLFRKMGLPLFNAIIPVVAEWRLSKVLFRFRRSFWRPFVTALILFIGGYFINPFRGSGARTARLLIDGGIIVYGFMLMRLYWRLSKCFGKKFPFFLLMMLVPPLGVGILGYGKSVYLGPPELKPIPKHGKLFTFLSHAGIALISAAEIAVLVGGIGILTLRTHGPRWFVNMRLDDVYEKTKDIVGEDSFVSREESMGESYVNLASFVPSREKFTPDHSSDQSVVVLAYIVGSNLEDAQGLASANIRQMIDASKQGSALTFVLECGGAERWFTKGISEASYGRYTIHDGKLEKVLDLPDSTCMSEGEELADFLAWSKENYPADRYLLSLWDHGGGLGTGFGVDELNRRTGDYSTMPPDEIVRAIADSGITFDIIGFDACLMQTIEIAHQLEPYADYYLASEEVEGGLGWDWAPAFGKLAANPGLPSEDFGKEIIACYDPYNTATSSEPSTTSTLSFVDLTMVKPLYEKLEGLFGNAKEAIATDSGSFASLSLSGSKAYTFQNYEQVDLVDFLTRLKGLDYQEKIIPSDDLDTLIDAAKACVVYRNANSAEGINGMAITFPVSALQSYSYDYKQLTSFSMDAQKSLYNDFFSIIAAQKIKEAEKAGEEGGVLGVLNGLVSSGYADEDWYVEGFENYETQEALIDIPLIEVEDGYLIDLPEKAWDIIAEQLLFVYERAEDGRLRYLGKDYLGGYDEDCQGLVAFDGTWINVGGQMVCYEAGTSRLTDEGIVYTGTTKAMLNDELKVSLHIEWDPVTGVGDDPVTGCVTGYDIIIEDNPILQMLGEQFSNALEGKAMAALQPGDRLQFLFDYYDDEGYELGTETYGGTVTVTKMETLTVSDQPLPEGDTVVFGGALIDVYQRTMTTEKIEAQVA